MSRLVDATMHRRCLRVQVPKTTMCYVASIRLVEQEDIASDTIMMTSTFCMQSFFFCRGLSAYVYQGMNAS